MNNTIPFESATHAPQITVDVNILTMLKQAASCLTEAAGRDCLLYTSPSPRDVEESRMPSSA